MFTVRSVHIAFELWGCVFSLIAMSCVFYSGGMNHTKRRILFLLELFTVLLLLCDAFAWGFRGYSGMVGYFAVRISNFLVFFISDVLLFGFHAYVCSYLFPNRPVWMQMFPRSEKGNMSSDDAPQKGITKYLVGVVYWVALVGMLLVIVSQFTGMYYTFDSNNVYHRSSLHPLSLAIAFFGIMLDTVLLVRERRHIKRQVFLSMLSYIVLPAVSAVILMFYYGVSLVNISICISMLFMFAVAIVEQSREKMEQSQLLAEQNLLLVKREKELSDLHIKVILSQIKPHFIYNTLSSIQDMCVTDPELAEETLGEFAGYLRGSLDALKLEDCIPFTKELKHLKNYLAIEKKRFEGRIQVVYDIEEDTFMIPPMTLQTVTENAVKHGITKRPEGGTIHIHTYREQDSVIICIEDNGVGFDLGRKPEDGRTHIGIANARKCMETMCGGSLTINSIIGQGTTVELRIPDKNELK